MNDDEIKQLLLENRASLERVEQIVGKMRRKMLWNTVGSILKIVLILGPIILGIIYLSPFVKKYMGGLQSALNILQIVPEKDDLDSLNNQGIMQADTLEMICDPQSRQSIVEQLCK